MSLAEEKFEALRKYLQDKLQEGLLIAFSGGVDSAFLLWTASDVLKSLAPESRGKLVALTTLSPSMAGVEKKDAMDFSSSLNEENLFEHIWKESKEFDNPNYVKNDSKRCYYCKSELFEIAKKVASQKTIRWIAYGYNASDRGDYRPGHEAAKESRVLAPLDEVNLTKNEIRLLMKQNGLSLSEKPASPCLSSRVMTGVSVTQEKLQIIEEMEELLRQANVKVFRVRFHEDAQSRFLRIEVASDELIKVLPIRDELVVYGKNKGMKWVMLDLEGYKTGGAVRLGQHA